MIRTALCAAPILLIPDPLLGAWIAACYTPVWVRITTLHLPS